MISDDVIIHGIVPFCDDKRPWRLVSRKFFDEISVILDIDHIYATRNDKVKMLRITAFPFISDNEISYRVTCTIGESSRGKNIVEMFSKFHNLRYLNSTRENVDLDEKILSGITTFIGNSKSIKKLKNCKKLHAYGYEDDIPCDILKSLEELSCFNIKVIDINKLINCEYLSFDHSIGGIEIIKLPKLKILKFSNSNIDISMLYETITTLVVGHNTLVTNEMLAKFVNVTKFELWNNNTVSYIGNMRKCKDVLIHGCPLITDSSFDTHDTGCDTGQNMCDSIKKFTFLSSMNNLNLNKFRNAIDIAWNSGDMTFDKLGKGVKKISISFMYKNVYLNNFVDCEELTISGNRKVTSKVFEKLIKLKILDCSYTDVECLNFLENCTELNCDDCRSLTNEGIFKIASKIKIMKCRYDCGLSDLNGLINCEYLDACGNKNITNESISKLGRGLNNFIDCIELNCTNCDNITIDSIRGMKSLRQIRCNPKNLPGLEKMSQIKIVINERCDCAKLENLKSLL